MASITCQTPLLYTIVTPGRKSLLEIIFFLMNPVGDASHFCVAAQPITEVKQGNLMHSQVSILALGRLSPAVHVALEGRLTGPCGCSENSLTAIIIGLRADRDLKRQAENLFCEKRTNSSVFLLNFWSVPGRA
jgi:hypothetical protein